MPPLVRTFNHLLAVLAIASGLIVAVPWPAPADESGGDYGRMLLVLDSSGSMAEPAGGGESKMEAARAALTRVVEALPTDSAVGLRVYGAKVFSKKQKGACSDSQLVVPTGTDNRAELTRAIKRFKPYGETPIAHALQQAAKDLGDEGKRSIVLVSDGIATCQPDPCDVAADLAAAGINLQIDVVGLGVSGSAREQLQCIADAGGGTYYNADSADDIADTLTRVSQRAVRPFTLNGTPVEGAAAPDGAPTLTEGRWTDHLGGEGAPDAVRHYRIERSIPNSTIHVTATTRGTPDKWDEISVALTDDLGDECDTAQSSRNTDQYAVLSAQAMAGRDKDYIDEQCWKGGALGLRVERGNFSDTKRAPIAINVFEEPPAQRVEALPEPWNPTQYVAPQVSGAARTLTAGTSFEDAPRITTGLYELDIVPGETQFVKVPLDWGQQFRVRAAFPAGTPGVEELTGVQGPFADVKMYSPLLGQMPGAYQGTDSTTILPGSDSGELTAMSSEVRYRNRGQYGDDTAYLPGNYFVAVTANADTQGDTWVQPYKLAVEVVGEPTGAPRYVEGASVSQPLEESADDTGPGPDSSDRAERAAAQTSADESTWLGPGSLAGLGAGVLAAAAVGVVLRRRRSDAG
jgi:Ca-activated chloride channel family protein